MSHRLREALFQPLPPGDLELAVVLPELEDTITAIPVRLLLAGMA
jgi:hypothetical protein